jgi:tetrahydromethanopterin S-methyltransferase subunit G
MKKAVIVCTLCILSISGFGQDKTLPYTLEDRERLIRMGDKVENLEKKVDAGFARADAKMDTGFSDIKQQINTLFGTCIGLIGILLVIIFWDRRSAMQPQTEAMRIMQAKLDALKKELTAKGII